MKLCDIYIKQSEIKYFSFEGRPAEEIGALLIAAHGISN